LPLVMGALGIAGAAGLVTDGERGKGKAGSPVRLATLLAGAGVVAGYLWLDRPRVRLDPYKYLAYVRRLVKQGSAERVAVECGARAVVEAYRSDVFHDLPFLSGGTAPPPMLALVADGHRAGSVMQVDSASQAGVVDQTLMAFAYGLASPQPRVLLLGETGGGNVWLAARHGAARIDLVQPDANILALLRGPLRDAGGAVLDLPGVRATVAEPRHFVEHNPDRFDLIQLVGLEWAAAGSGGMGGLGQDHLLTVEGVVACLRRLTPDGLLFVCRGIQTPPRDNLKLLATFAEALSEIGIESAADHIVIVRDFQAVCSIVKTTAWSEAQINRVRAECDRRNLTPVWFSGIRPNELNQPDVLPGPSDAPGDWYHYAAQRLFSDERLRFIQEWPFDIRAPTDDRPFFLDFCRLGSLARMRQAFGDLWLTRAELGFLFAIAATLIIGVVGSVLTVLPLAVTRPVERIPGRAATVGYFAAIGLAYLLLEMTFLSRLTHLIGDPVRTAAVTIAAFLLLSGLGSLSAQRFGATCRAYLPRMIIGLVLVGIALLIVLGRLPGLAGALGELGRTIVAVLAIAPLAYLMGLPMPTALARIDRAAGALIPWAWAVNGFASVLAAPLAHAIGMTWGFSLAGGLGLMLYLVAAALFRRLPRV
ncbi:MAG: polyamine aminopropyltransferase, partial [Planctomycetota bacterium]